MKKIFSIKVRSRLFSAIATVFVFMLAIAAGFGGQSVWGENAQAASNLRITNLAAPAQIDEIARQQYLDNLAERERRREAELQRQKATSVASATQKSSADAQTATSQSDRLIIPKIGLNSQLATVGMAGSAIDVHATLPGRWNQSAKPGGNGAVFVDGHNHGIFASLGRLAVGDQIAIVSGGETYTYQVVYREETPLQSVDMRKALAVYGGGAQGLNLMTCAGSPMGNTYSHRLVVYAVRV